LQPHRPRVNVLFINDFALHDGILSGRCAGTQNAVLRERGGRPQGLLLLPANRPNIPADCDAGMATTQGNFVRRRSRAFAAAAGSACP
jgi:hypothetical protein